jgi:uncharacterized protein (DUF885 family)
MKKFWLLAWCWLAALPLVTQQPRSIDAFFDEFTAEWVRMNPNLATATRYFTGPEQDRLERQLTPLTTTHAQARIEKAREGLVALRAFDRSRMTDAQRISADLMAWQLDTIVREQPFLDRSFPLEQMQGANVALPNFLTVVHPLQSMKDAQNYVAVLGQVATRMDEAIAESKSQEKAGALPPRFILQATIRQMQNFAGVAPSQNPLVTTLEQKVSGVKDVTPAQRAELRSQAETIVTAQVYPAWRRAIAALESQLPKSTDDAGLWRFGNGAEAYAYFLRRYTSTSMTADQIHEIGLREVARIEKEMDTLFRTLGRTEGTVKERSAKLSDDLRYPNPASDESRQQIMSDIDAIVRDAEKRSQSLFDKRPHSPVIAQPYPRFREMEDKTKPRFRQIRAFGIISAFNEGWGLYAERLAAESGWYGDDVEGRLGQLYDALWRARRLVVDTGIHAKRWTRQQAIDYGIEASEVERYVVYPGQACSYMIGQLKIVELREQAKQALGAKFLLPQFHNLVLGTGTVPLELLEQQVNEWVRTTAARP